MPTGGLAIPATRAPFQSRADSPCGCAVIELEQAHVNMARRLLCRKHSLLPRSPTTLGHRNGPRLMRVGNVTRQTEGGHEELDYQGSEDSS